MRPHEPSVVIAAGRSQPPTDNEFVVPPGNTAGRSFPSVFIRVHSRFPTSMGRAGSGVTVQVGSFDMAAQPFGRTIVQSESPEPLRSWIKAAKDGRHQWKCQSAGTLSNKDKQVVEPIPIIHDARLAKSRVIRYPKVQ
jgi:hypothetical protein